MCFYEGLGLVIDLYIYIYIGAFFVILIELYPGRVSGRVSSRVSDFFDKTRTRPGPASGFFKKSIPDPIPNQTG